MISQNKTKLYNIQETMEFISTCTEQLPTDPPEKCQLNVQKLTENCQIFFQKFPNENGLKMTFLKFPIP